MAVFSEFAWTECSPLYRHILDLPFNRELAAGTLSEERFQFYMIQDALYLEQYARALAMAAARAPDAAAMEYFAHASQQALVVERALHGGFFEKFGIDPEQAAGAEPSPTCLGYTSFLLAVAQRDGYEELVEAVIAIADRTAAAATGDTRNAMLKAFKRSVQYEWMFWDSAWRLERWPIAP